MADISPSRQDIHAELDRARADFSRLITARSAEELDRPSNGTRWTNRQLLFQMLLGYLIIRSLRLIVQGVSRLPAGAQQAFARLLDVAYRPFHHVNYWGAVAGAHVLSPHGMDRQMDRVIRSLHHHLDAESDASLATSMPFPVKWDPYFTTQMTLLDVYHYATIHYVHHRRQLTLID